MAEFSGEYGLERWWGRDDKAMERMSEGANERGSEWAIGRMGDWARGDWARGEGRGDMKKGDEATKRVRDIEIKRHGKKSVPLPIV